MKIRHKAGLYPDVRRPKKLQLEVFQRNFDSFALNVAQLEANSLANLDCQEAWIGFV